MQVDGEPWEQPPGELKISRQGQATMLKCLNNDAWGQQPTILETQFLKVNFNFEQKSQ